MTIKNALIVDDSKSARTMLKRLLEKMDIVSLAVESAEEALIYLEDQQPDVIFMDHMMPGMDGIEATQSIKSNPKTQSIPTVMYTSKEGESYLTLAKSHGAFGVLPKPASQKAVMSVINALDNPAANDVPAPVQEAQEIDNSAALAEIEKTITNRLNSAVSTAKAEIAAGLDTVSHQLTQSNHEQLTIVERNLRQQVKNLQTQLLDLQDNHTLFTRLQPQIQKHAILVARKVSQKKVDSVVKDYQSKFNTFEEKQRELITDISRKSQMATIKGAFSGAILGALIAIAACHFF